MSFFVRDRLSEIKGAGSSENLADSEPAAEQPRKASKGSKPGSSTSVGSNDADNQTFMAEFFAEVQEITQSLDQLEALVMQVKEKHNHFVTSVDGSKAKAILCNVQDQMKQITTLAGRVRQAVKNMDAKNKELEQESSMKHMSIDGESGGLDVAVRIRKSQHVMLARRLVQIMTKYNDVQLENSSQYRELIHREMKIVDPSVTEDKIDSVIENGVQNVFVSNLQAAKEQLEKIENRHQGILALEQSLVELHEMFLDLAIIIESSGEALDRVEALYNTAAVYVHEGATKLGEAAKIQKKHRWLKAIF